MKKNILCIGSGGFILGNFIRQSIFLKKTFSISSIDRVRNSNLMQNIYQNKNHSFHIADILDFHILNILFKEEEPDVCILGVTESDVLQNLKSTVIGTQNVIQACVENNTKLIYLSDASVYGPQKSESQAQYTEEDPYNPANPFAAASVSAELLIKTAKDLRYNILRLSNNYGNWQSRNSFIPSIIKNIKFDNLPFFLDYQGNQFRQWTHVNDTSDAIFQVLEKAPENEIYNISSNQEFLNIEIFQLIANAVGKGNDLLKFSDIDNTSYNEYRYSTASKKIRELGWIPEVKFKTGIIDVCQWFVSNNWIFKNAKKS